MQSKKKIIFVSEVSRGFILMLSSLGWILKSPKQIFRGVIPAFISAGIMSSLIILFLIFLKPLVRISTSFSNDWAPWLESLTKIAMGAGMTISLVLLCFISFVALTLIIGDSFYNKIWKDYELHRNNLEVIESYEPTFNEALHSGLTIFFKGIGISILSLVLTLIPLIGPVVSTVTAFALTAYMLSFELTAKSMSARYFNTLERNFLQHNRKGLSIGYGLTFQTLMIIPLGSLIAIPVSTVASAKLASILKEDALKDYPAMIAEAEKRRIAKTSAKDPKKDN